jgi:hypothetical protein
MAQGYQAACLFCGHYSRDTRNAQNVAFFYRVPPKGVEGCSAHGYTAGRDCQPFGFLLAADIHHYSRARRVEMRKLHPRGLLLF